MTVVIATLTVNELIENVSFLHSLEKTKISQLLISVPVCLNYVSGAPGMLLATPLAVVLKIILESFEETKRLARLMGPAEDVDEGKISSG